MPPLDTRSRLDPSTAEAQALLAIGRACDAQAPLLRGSQLADLLRLDLEEARRVVTRLEGLGLLHRVDIVTLRRVLDWDQVPDLEGDPARPRAEGRRRTRDLDVYAEIVKRQAMGLPVRDEHLPDGRGGILLPDTRRTVLARLRDPARPGGALLWPYLALVLTSAGEVARGALLEVLVAQAHVGSGRAAS